MSKGSVLGPFVSLKYLFEKPRTVAYPYRQREISPRYRGFHKNDLEKCIGCGNCADICPCDAIEMVKLPGITADPKRGSTDERPQVNYGRCTYCGLCVDVCPTGSLSLSQDFIHNDVTPESFVAVPRDEKSAPELFVDDLSDFEARIDRRRRSDAGYKSELAFTFAHLDGHADEMEVVPPEERVRSFVEMVRGFTREQALAEASRCFECQVCEEACPAHMNIADYIRSIWADDPAAAARHIYKTNPLPGVCGRVCTHNCEKACALSHRGDPVSIRWLKRYAMDQIPLEEYNRILGTEEIVKPTGKRVAIVGAGPSGLSAAYYLALMGYAVTVFEEKEKPGGMMRYGIPEYRLPYAALDKDIAYIESVGVEIRCNTRVGEDVTLDDLHRDYDAVFVGIGLQGGRSTRIPGTEHRNVFQAITLLREITHANVVLHTSEAGYLRKGYTPAPRGTRISTKVISFLGRKVFPGYSRYKPAEPDILWVESGYRPGDFPAELLHTPGHTEGSASLVWRGEVAFVGDTLFGYEKDDCLPWFANDLELLKKSWQILLNTSCDLFYPSHGHPVKRALLEESFRKHFGEPAGKV